MNKVIFYITEYVELKNFNLTTKSLNKIKVNVNQNDSLENFFSLNMKHKST